VAQLKNDHAVEVLANNLRQHRLRCNLTQEKLAYIAEIEYSQVSRIERGLVNTSVSVIFALARALEIKPGQLLEF
jgi:transcriptional regulator with XRE-family HTH domain